MMEDYKNYTNPSYAEMGQFMHHYGIHLHQNVYEFCGWMNRVNALKPKLYMEIGVYKLGSAESVYYCFPSIEKLIAIDINDLSKDSFLGPKLEWYKDRMVFVHGDSSQPETLLKVKEILGGRKLDAIFIDGDHSFNGLVKDYSLFSPLVRVGGLIGFHDCMMANMPGHPPGPCEEKGHRGSRTFWQALETNYPERCELIDVEPGPWGNYGVGVYTVANEDNK